MLLRAEEDLLVLSQRFGGPAEQQEIAERIARQRAGIATLWNEQAGLWMARDLIDGVPIEVGTSAGFLPLYAHAADAERTRRAAATLARWAEQVRFLVPSADPADPAFEPLR